MDQQPKYRRPKELPRVARAKRTGRRETLDLGVLNTHLGYFVRRLQVQIFKDFIRFLSPFDLRPGQFSVLMLIAANQGRSQAEIGERLDIERAGVAKILNELEQRGWVQRLAAVNDGRTHALFLTAEGEKAVAQIQARGQEFEQGLARRLGAGRRRQLLGLLKDFG